MNTLLLCIDFINDIIHPKGKIAASAKFVAEHQVIQHANAAIATARVKNIPIVFVKVGFSPNYIECPAHSPVFAKAKELGALQLGTWGTELHEELDVQPNDTIIMKHRVSALYATSLATILTAQRIEKVIICGVSTNMTVETTTRELHDRDYQVIVLSDACGATTQEIHTASLTTLARIATVQN